MKPRVALLLCLVCRVALALDPAKAITQYVHESWQTEQGLPQDSVYTICQTGDGYLWVGTEEGAARFDGARFVVFDRRSTPALPHDGLSRLYEDRGGALWIGTRGGGVTRLRDGVFTRLTAKDGLSSDDVLSIFQDRADTLWFGTAGGGMTSLRNGRFRAWSAADGLASDKVRFVTQDRAGTIWIGHGNGLQKIENGRVVSLPIPEGMSHNVMAVLEARDGTLWIGTYGGGVLRYRGGAFTALTTKDGLSSDEVSSLLEDRDGNVWIGTFSGGVNRWRDGRVDSFTSKQGLANDYVAALLEDREGSLWIGTRGAGLHRLRDAALTPLGAPEGLPDGLRCVLEDHGGALWIGGDGGLTRLAGGTTTRFSRAQGLATDEVLSLAETRDGTLWIGTRRGGVARWDGRSFTALTTKDRLSDDTVNAVAEDAAGDVWVGTDRGLNRISRGAVADFPARGALAAAHVLALLPTWDGALWIAAGELHRIARGGALTTFTTKDGLSSDSVMSLHEDAEGVLWIGTTRGGVNRFENGAFRAVSEKEGLADAGAYAILEDARGDLWTTSNKGIARVAKTAVAAVMDGRAARVASAPYGILDGMRIAECAGGSQPSAARLRDGRLVFATPRGLVFADPARLARNGTAPTVVVEEVAVDRKPLALPRSGARLVVPAGAGRLDFRYTATSLRAPSRVRFRYRLEGWDKGWVDAGAERVARYTNLPPRAYTFRVVASNDDGVWNETGARLALSLTPLFWQTRWFALLCVLAAGALGVAAYRARIRILKRREDELVALVKEKTNDLEEANDRISRLLASSPAASESLAAWSRSVAEEIAKSVGARAIGVFELDDENVTPVSDAGLAPPSQAEIEGNTAADSKDGTLIPVLGPAGETLGALVVAGAAGAIWGETERRLVTGFAHQLGGALAIRRLRGKLAAAEERRAATRRDMHERGIATLQICPACGRCTDHLASACPADGSTLEAPRTLPYRLLDRYRFRRVLGRGGMGVVLAAEDEKLAREVAVKLIRPEGWTDPDARERFEREARAIARVKHAGVVLLYDSGELEDGTLFLVMERLVGSDLGHVLKTHGRGSAAQVARVARQGGSALAAAHRAGVVHRDIKPENVFLARASDGFAAKLVDFGLAKSLRVEKGLTQTGVALGTPAYMPPEQVLGEDVDARADVYSFAAVLYEALTGRKAVPTDDAGAVFLHVLHGEPAAPSALVPRLPPEVDAAFAAALAKKREDRPADLEAWAEALAGALERVPDGGARWPDELDERGSGRGAESTIAG